MPFADHTCVTVMCDGCNDDCWDDGVMHFVSREEATTYLKGADWLITDDKALCRECSAEADCEVTGHQYGGWDSREHMGIAFRARHCEHCGDTDYDPPWNDLMALRSAALVVDRAGDVS